MDHVDGHVTGWTELRVHGVAGTAPEAVLEHPDVVRVAGNAQAGFYRRLWEARSIAADTAWSRREAYSWGGLTSGDNTRALWLLLLPFMLLNLSFAMVPHPRVRDPGPPATAYDRRLRALDGVGRAVAQVLALSFTGIFALTAVTVAMDLVGWQCAAGHPPDGAVCGTSWLGWLAWTWLDRPGRQLAVTALVPLAVIAVLWWLGRSTWFALERVDADQTVAAPRAVTPFEDRSMWNGRAAVRRLRAVHVTVGLAMPGIFAVAPLPGVAPVLKGGVVGALVLLVAWMVGEACRPSIGRRARPLPPADLVAHGTAPDGAGPRTEEEARDVQRRAERGDRYRWSPFGALALTALALVVAATAPSGPPTGGALPWLAGTVYVLFAVQAVLLTATAVIAHALAAAARDPDAARAGPESRVGEPPVDGAAAEETPAAGAPVEEWLVAGPPAWHGLAGPGVALLAWALAGGFSAGVILRAAQTLGTPVVAGQSTNTVPPPGTDHPLVVPTAYTWTAVTGLVLGLLTVGAAGVVWWRLSRPTDETIRAVGRAYGVSARENAERRDQIARAWTRATWLSRRVQGAVGFLLIATVVVVAFGAAGVAWVGADLNTDASWLVEAADVAISGFVLGLVAVGRQAYRSPTLRRSVGILWDLGTFWPRAVHPLAPPCYAERAVPDLVRRLQYATAAGRVLLSCHSQGSVLGAAALLQVETPVSARTAFLTYGSPLARLYAGFFPAYVNGRALGRLGGLLSAAPGGAAPVPRERSSWRWRNLHRPSDPIGGPIFCSRELDFPRDVDPRADPGDVDRPLVDPVFARPAGDPCFPPVLGHSNYLVDPILGWTTHALRAGVLPGVVADGPAPPP